MIRLLRTFTPLGVWILCAGSAVATNPRSDREQQNLKGPVREVREEGAAFIDNGGNSSLSSRDVRTITKYDSNGNESELVFYARLPNGERGPFDRTKYFRSPSGDRRIRIHRLVKPIGGVIGGVVRTAQPQTRLSYPADVLDRDGASVEFESRSYNKDGALATREFYKGEAPSKSGFYERYTYSYSSDRSSRVTEYIDWRGMPKGRSVTRFDAKGLELETVRYKNGNEIDGRWTYSGYQLDGTGNWIERSVQSFSVYSTGESREGKSIEYRVITYYAGN